MMYGRHDLKVRNPLEREPIKGAPHGDEVLKRYRLKRDEHENSIYVECGEENIQGLVKEMNQELQGRGGGKPTYAQGKVSAKEPQIKGWLKEKLR